jgi:hypothetical protein
MGGHGRDHWHVRMSPQEGRGGQDAGAGDHDAPVESPDHPAEPNNLGVPSADEDGPIDDLSAMQADDALLDALGGTDPDLSRHLADEELAGMLLSWRQEADSEPMAELVDTDAAMSVIAASKARTGKRRHRFLVPIATAAAVLSIAFTGVGLAAKSAQPGDTLWTLTKVLYADHATSVEAAGTVQSDIEQAKQAMAVGDYQRAQMLLEKAKKALGSVQSEDGKKDLQKLHEDLKTELQGEAPPPVGSGSAGSSSSAVVPPPGSTSSQDPGSSSSSGGSDSTSVPGPPVEPAPPTQDTTPPDTTPPPESTTTDPASPPASPTSGTADQPGAGDTTGQTTTEGAVN